MAVTSAVNSFLSVHLAWEAGERTNLSLNAENQTSWAVLSHKVEGVPTSSVPDSKVPDLLRRV